MRNPGGHYFICDESGVQQEHDTFTCRHCNRIVVVKPKADPADMGGRCYVCDSLICKVCVARGLCDVIEKKLDRAEARDRLYRDMRG
jgi:hypothetical protein